MSAPLRFLLLAELLGLAALPLAAVLLARLPAGAAAAFSKPLGLLAAGWLAWLGASFGLQYGVGLVAAAVLALALAGALVARRRPALLRAAVCSRSFWASEATFATAFAVLALLTAFAPDVWGTEKPMDMALINAINAGDSMPPLNPWLAGETLDGYYYLGHLLAATVIRLTGAEPTVGYNLALALFYGLAAVSAFGLGTAVGAMARRSPLLCGLVAALLTVVAGNLASAVLLAELDGPLTDYPWFQASRVVPDTINEFPAFSWLLGDLHAHVMAIPFTLLALAFALQWLDSGARVPDLVAGGVVSGLLYAINAWSYPVAAGLLLLALAVAAGPRPGVLLRDAGLLLAIGLLAVGPFLMTFEPPAAGLEPVSTREPLGSFLLHAAMLSGVAGWLVAGAYATALVAGGRRRPRALAVAGALAVAAILVGAALDLAGPVVALAAAGFALLRLMRANSAGAERFLWLSAFGAAVCLLIPELVFVSDAFAGGALERMNTVFKLGSNGWLLLSVAAATALALDAPRTPGLLRRGWRAGTLLLAAAATVFPIAGAYARTGGFAGPPRLDGLGWLAATAPGDVAAVDWLRANTPGDAIVLETTGDDYSPAGHARISTFSGRATVLGWPGHVLQWGEDPGDRRSHIDTLYRAPGAARVVPLLERYGVRYVVVGPLERADHGTAGLAKWDRLGTRVLDREGTILWRLDEQVSVRR